MLLDSVLNVRGSVDLFVEDPVDMTHGEVHSYFVDMDGVSSSAFDGDMKVGSVGGKRRGGEERGSCAQTEAARKPNTGRIRRKLGVC